MTVSGIDRNAERVTFIARHGYIICCVSRVSDQTRGTDIIYVY